MFLEMMLKGLSWGIFCVSVLVPICAFSVAWSHLGPILRKRKDEELELLTDLLEEDFEEEPPLPDNKEVSPRYRFTASTIVRPPPVVRKEDIENED